MKLKLLVTGGAGFIGSHLVQHFQGIASEIIVLDNLRPGDVKHSRANIDRLSASDWKPSSSLTEALALMLR